MQVVIEISDFDKDWINSGCHIPDGMNLRISEAIKNGIVLPNGHGRLIDANILEECQKMMDTIIGECKYAVRMDEIRNMPTIIPSEKENI